MKYSIKLGEKLEIESLGLYFSFKAIAPYGSKYGAWPYCLEYSFKGLDFFGLGDYGSNKRVDNPDEVNTILNCLNDGSNFDGVYFQCPCLWSCPYFDRTLFL